MRTFQTEASRIAESIAESIAQSIAQTECVECAATLDDVLAATCDHDEVEYVQVARSQYDVWGTDRDGHTWRITLRTSNG